MVLFGVSEITILEKIREVFPKVKSVEEADLWLSKLDAEEGAMVDAYKASLLFVKSRYVKFPLTKLKYFKRGKKEIMIGIKSLVDAVYVTDEVSAWENNGEERPFLPSADELRLESNPKNLIPDNFYVGESVILWGTGELAEVKFVGDDMAIVQTYHTREERTWPARSWTLALRTPSESSIPSSSAPCAMSWRRSAS